MTIAKGPRGALHTRRVPVPPELRRKLAALTTTHGCGGAVKLLGLTHSSLYDASEAGGLVTPAMLERLIDAVARAEKGAA